MNLLKNGLFCKRGIVPLLFACSLLAPISFANAGIITIGQFSPGAQLNQEDFERIATPINGEILTNQFAANGLRFVSNNGINASLFNNRYCYPASTALTGNSYIGIGTSTSCRQSSSITSISIFFEQLTSAFSFSFASNARDNSKFKFELLAEGNLLSTVNLDLFSLRNNSTKLFPNITFDEVRITESSSTNWFWADNFEWNYSQVNAPATGLLLLGSLGLVMLRRRT
mmetsp:Transcript_28068/g.89544  ORF Transcript_28068/g.89544 Transcript_28068/m.89544 type:complete len:228 (-) Transcript_28068:41-724(-)